LKSIKSIADPRRGGSGERSKEEAGERVWGKGKGFGYSRTLGAPAGKASPFPRPRWKPHLDRDKTIFFIILEYNNPGAAAVKFILESFFLRR
jgi:hypothetical protein